jgi:hypothetical protein
VSSRYQHLEVLSWYECGGAIPTGGMTAASRFIKSDLKKSVPAPQKQRPPEEQFAEFVRAAHDIFWAESNAAQQVYERTGDMNVIAAFARGESEVLEPLLEKYDDRAYVIISMLMQPRPRSSNPGAPGDPVKIQELYRWIYATVNEEVNRGMTVSAAIRKVVLDSDEADARRHVAGLRDFEPDRDPEHNARTIYYRKSMRWGWKFIVMAGLNLIGRRTSERL